MDKVHSTHLLIAQPPRTPYEIRAGSSFIPGVLISGINADLPGMVIGQVSQDVHDSASYRYLLIPKGTRIVGESFPLPNSRSKRVKVVWQRLVFPDGKALELGSMEGLDAQGMPGVVAPSSSGTRFNIMLNRDLDFSSPYRAFDYNPSLRPLSR